jgi:hypothetical protein
MEATLSSETLVNFCQTTRRHIPQDGTLHRTLILLDFVFFLGTEQIPLGFILFLKRKYSLDRHIGIVYWSNSQIHNAKAMM